MPLALPHLSRRDLSYFFYSQHFSDGVRTTFAILLPALLGAQWEQFAAGITISTGAVCLSVTDSPGPPGHRRNGQLAAWVLVGLVVVLMSLAEGHHLLMGALIGVLSFSLTMLLVWGARAGAVGSAALLAMALTLAHPPSLPDLLPHVGLLLLGGLWYMLLALLQQQALPYRGAQQALGECLHAMAGFLKLKATFYNSATDLDDDYRRLVAQQVVVNEKQEAVRDQLFRSRQIVSEGTSTSRRLVLTFTEAVDLYDHITAGYYDYAVLRRAFGASGVLSEIEAMLGRLATDLDYLGSAILANRAYGTPPPERLPELARLQASIAALPAPPDPALGPSTLVLKKILVNLRDLARRTANIRRYFDESLAATAPDPGRVASHGRFVASQEIEPRALLQNLTLSSSVFRHAVRMAVACLVAFGVAETLWHGQHNYWILMTVTIMLKPGFSLTRERNIQRIIGTLVGGVMGAFILWAVPNGDLRFGFLLVFMVVAYTFQRTQYLVTVIFLTAYLLIMFTFLGQGYLGIIQERVTDTLLGCAIAFGTAYLLFPRWESDQLPDLLAATLRANLAFLRQLADRLAGRDVPATTYRLLRKDVYVASANLAAAFQRMLSEPRRTRRHPTEIHQFVVLNHILSANISALTTTWEEAASPLAVPPEGRRALTSAQAALTKSLARLAAAAPEAGGSATALAAEVQADSNVATAPVPDRSLAEQLTFLQKVSTDLSRVTEALAE